MLFCPSVVFTAASGAAAYVGPGDVVASAVIWGGLRAYTSASIGANAVRLRESGGNTEQDFATIAGGGLDLAAIATFKGANNLFVVKLYDQVSTNHYVQATAGNQPAFILSGLGALPVMRFAAGPTLSSGAITQATPLTYSYVSSRTAGFTSYQDVVGGSGFFMGYDTVANNTMMYGGSLVTSVAATDSTFHAFQMVYNGASSDSNVDGSVNTVNPGAGGGLVGGAIQIGTSGFSHLLQGDVVEVGMWGSAFSAGNSSAMSSNQHTYWGF